MLGCVDTTTTQDSNSCITTALISSMTNHWITKTYQKTNKIQILITQKFGHFWSLLIVYKLSAMCPLIIDALR
jgi:hypothetical protein